MKAEIITSGTELLLGEITDTNTPFLAQELASIGMNVYHHTTVGDNPKRLLEAIEHAEERANVLIISGGLGPTQDDITKDVLAKHLGVELVFDEKSFDKVAKRYNTTDISKGNEQQAQILEGSKALENDVGMAAGIFMEKNEKIYVLLPGPPNEFELMVRDYLMPLLSELVSEENILRSRNLNFYGIPEATMADKLHSMIEKQTNPTIAIYASYGVITVRLTANGSTEVECEKLLDEMAADILDIVGTHFFSYGQTSLQDIIFDQLAEEQTNISLLEMQTNGEVLTGWTHELKEREVFTSGLFFPKLKEAEAYFEVENALMFEQGKKQINKNKAKEANEQLALTIQKELETTYGVVVTNWGGNEQFEEHLEKVMLMSIALPDGEIVTKEVDFSNRTFFAPWVIALKVSDFVRRVLLNLPQLKDHQY